MLTIQYFQPKWAHSINKGLYVGNTRYIRKYMVLDFDVYLKSKKCNLQRPLCWTLEQKQAFIVSVLRNQPVNSVVIVQHTNEDKSVINYVIDGKQRINSLFQFIDGEFPINVEGEDYFFNDLHETIQRHIMLSFDFKWDTHYSYWDTPISDDTMIEIFESVNFLGTPVDVEHINAIKNKK